MLLPETIETPRLRLRKPLVEDAYEIYKAYCCDPEVTHYLTWLTHTKLEEAFEAVISRLGHWELGTDFSWIITPREGNTVMGMISAHPDDHKWRWRIGYVLARPFWGSGFMTEAVRALIATLFDQPNILRVWAFCDEENLASAQVLLKAGMQREGLMRGWSIHPNISARPRDCWSFSILRHEIVV